MWLPFMWIMRGILSIPGYYHKVSWWNGVNVLASDGRVVSEDTKIERGIKYGPMSLHAMDRIVYEHRNEVNKKNAVVYIHGGGFIVCRSEHTSHGAVPFVRNSEFQTAYSLDYPYCPEHRFPLPLLSVIQAIVYLHEKMQIENVLLVGESSGGLLVTAAAAAMMNRKKILNPILHKCDPDVLELTCPNLDLDTKFPKITGVVSICGIHDDTAWKKSLISTKSVFHRLEWSLVQYALAFALNCFRNVEHTTKDSSLSRCTMVSMLENVSDFRYASTMFICAEHDPLTESAKRAHKMLIQNSIQSKLKVYANQHHGFYGLPMQWRDLSYILQYFIPISLRNWMSSGRGIPVIQRATYDMLQFAAKTIE
jgi:acetyl esterase/lipase